MSEETQYDTNTESGVMEWAQSVIEESRGLVQTMTQFPPVVVYISAGGTLAHGMRLSFQTPVQVWQAKMAIPVIAVKHDAEAAILLCEGFVNIEVTHPKGEGVVTETHSCLCVLLDWRGPESGEGGFFGGGTYYGHGIISRNLDGDRNCAPVELSPIDPQDLTGDIRHLLPERARFEDMKPLSEGAELF